jgi:hypothetical protein
MYGMKKMLVLALLLAGTSSAWAGSGIAGFDTALTTVDTSVGAAGYGLFIAGLVGFFMLLVAGHYYLGFGMAICMFLIGALVGNRADMAGLVELSLGAELVPLESTAPAVPAPPLSVQRL